MPEYTTTQAAELLKTNRRNVQNYAKRHNLPKFGREYIITQNDIEGMREELGKVGRPKSSTNSAARAPQGAAQRADEL
jgi:hypothetical protein